jgi:hypothetical protein
MVLSKLDPAKPASSFSIAPANSRRVMYRIRAPAGQMLPYWPQRRSSSSLVLRSMMRRAISVSTPA